jgi:uncharacterized protein YndB with AHSA1/START domain
VSGVLVSKDVERLEITLERSLRSDVPHVWRSWTVPAELEAWWGPAGWVTTVRTLQLRPGGLWHFGMGPVGRSPEVWVRCTYREVLHEASLAYVEGFSDEFAADRDPEHQEVTLELFGLDPGRTRLVLRTRFPSAERLERIAATGMVDGWTGALERLDEHLEAV